MSGVGGSVATVAENSSGSSDIDAADVVAAYGAEMKRIDKLERRQIMFAKKFIAALTEWPPLPSEAGFDEYWQGDGEFDGIHYTKFWHYDDEK